MKKAYLVSLLVLLLTGCLLKPPQPPVTVPRVNGPVTVFVVTQSPSETPAVCTELPEGAALIVTPLSATKVQVELRGMQPGEQLVFQFTSRPSPQGNWRRITDEADTGVKENGSYTLTLGSLEPARGSTVNAWTVKVIHSRGVACQEITLPTP